MFSWTGAISISKYRPTISHLPPPHLASFLHRLLANCYANNYLKEILFLILIPLIDLQEPISAVSVYPYNQFKLMQCIVKLDFNMTHSGKMTRVACGLICRRYSQLTYLLSSSVADITAIYSERIWLTDWQVRCQLVYQTTTTGHIAIVLALKRKQKMCALFNSVQWI